jgi:hypothetical protein
VQALHGVGAEQLLVSQFRCILVKSMFRLRSIMSGKKFTRNEEMQLMEYYV